MNKKTLMMQEKKHHRGAEEGHIFWTQHAILILI